MNQMIDQLKSLETIQLDSNEMSLRVPSVFQICIIVRIMILMIVFL